MKVFSWLSVVFTYNTVRHAKIQSLWVGIIYRLAQLAILAYIIGWGLIYKKGYQSSDEVSSTITTKVKGNGFISLGSQPSKEPNFSDPYFFENVNKLDPKDEYRILDTPDFVVPALEYNSVFIMTNFIEIEQKKDYCGANKDSESCGIVSGVERYYKWQPDENNVEKKENFIRNTPNFTIFVKNDIEFKRFKIKQRNIFKNLNMTNEYISRCLYDEKLEPLCPVFSLDYILSISEPDKYERYQMLFKGGVIEINVDWDCNLDRQSICYPKYNFKRFDLQFKEQSASSGFNFRHTNKFKINDTDYRILYKAYGLRFYIKVTGTAGKFDIIPLMVKIGAGLGLMSVTFVIADCVLLYCPCASRRERKYYKKIKRFNAKQLKNKKLNDIDSITEIKV